MALYKSTFFISGQDAYHHHHRYLRVASFIVKVIRTL